MTKRKGFIRRRALRLRQCPDHPLYLFCLTGNEILQLADISRVSRSEAGKLIGYRLPDRVRTGGGALATVGGICRGRASTSCAKGKNEGQRYRRHAFHDGRA